MITTSASRLAQNFRSGMQSRMRTVSAPKPVIRNVSYGSDYRSSGGSSSGSGSRGGIKPSFSPGIAIKTQDPNKDFIDRVSATNPELANKYQQSLSPASAIDETSVVEDSTSAVEDSALTVDNKSQPVTNTKTLNQKLIDYYTNNKALVITGAVILLFILMKNKTISK